MWLEEEEVIWVTNLKGRYANQCPDPQVCTTILAKMGDDDSGTIQVEFSYIDFRYMNWRMDIKELM